MEAMKKQLEKVNKYIIGKNNNRKNNGKWNNRLRKKQ